MERSINPLFNIHERYKEMNIINPFRHKQLLRGLIAHWKLDDNAASSVVVDSVGGYNGQLGGSWTPRNTNTASISAKVGNGMTFKTSGTFDSSVGILVDDNDIFSFGDGSSDIPFSISQWVYLYSWGSGTTEKYSFFIARKDTYSVAQSAEWQINATYDSTYYRINFAIFSYPSTNSLVVRHNVTNDFLNAWHHIVCTYNGNGEISGLKIYIDGESVSIDATTEGGTYTAMSNRPDRICISGQSSSMNSTINYATDGIIDEVSIWRNRELGAEDVELLYNEGSGRALENW